MVPVDKLFTKKSIDSEINPHELTSRLARLYVDKITLANQRKQLLKRQNYLENQTIDSNTSNVINIDNNDNDNEALFEDLPFLVSSSESIVTTLRTIGQSKELKNIKNELNSLNTINSQLNYDISSIIHTLKTKTTILLPLNLSETININSTLDYLKNRSIGQTKINYSNNSKEKLNFIQLKLITNYKIQFTISGHMLNPAYCAIFDHTNQFIITGADDFLVKIWNVQSGLLIHTLKGHEGYISLIEISPDNSLIASACTMGTIRLWNIRTGKCIKVLIHGGLVNWIKFDEINYTLISAGDDGNCIVWDLIKIFKLKDININEYPMLYYLKTNIIEENELKCHNNNNNSKVISSNSLNPIDGTNSQESMDYFENPENSLNIQPNMQVKNEKTTSLADIIEDSMNSNENVMNLTEKSMNSAEKSINQNENIIELNSPENLINIIQTEEKEIIELSYFNWSQNTNSNESKLILPHYQELSQISTNYHTISNINDNNNNLVKIQCLDISPLGGIVVTGGEDGIARVWKYDNNNNNENNTIANNESLNTNKRTTSTSINYNINNNYINNNYNSNSNNNRIKDFELIDKYLLQRLEGHLSSITDLKFNSVGKLICNLC